MGKDDKQDLFADERISVSIKGELHSELGKFEVTRDVTIEIANKILKMLFKLKK